MNGCDCDMGGMMRNVSGLGQFDIPIDYAGLDITSFDPSSGVFDFAPDVFDASAFDFSNFDVGDMSAFDSSAIDYSGTFGFDVPVDESAVATFNAAAAMDAGNADALAQTASFQFPSIDWNTLLKTGMDVFKIYQAVTANPSAAQQYAAIAPATAKPAAPAGYAYNAAGQLVKAVKPTAPAPAGYVYNAAGQLVNTSTGQVVTPAKTSLIPGVSDVMLMAGAAVLGGVLLLTSNRGGARTSYRRRR